MINNPYNDNIGQNQNNAPVVKPVYQTLGRKVFWLFFLQASSVGFILLLASIIVFIFSFQSFMIIPVLGNMQKITMLVSLALFVVSIIIICVALISSWLTYINYTFLMADDSFKIKRGFLNKQEDAIPYHQIQNVDIERNFTFQMLGLSRLIILTAGHEDEPQKGNAEAEGVIPAIDQELATWLQTELLKRADIQKVTEADESSGKN
jgi:putative membrane protein